MAGERKDSALPIPVMLALAAAVGGTLWYQAPLKSSRPADTGMETRTTLGEERVQARLWQDPIEASETHRREESSKKEKLTSSMLKALFGKDGPQVEDDHHSIKKIADEIAGKVSEGDNITVLLVITDSSPYVTGSETRIRDRAAVVSALGVTCYVPDDEEHIGYFEWEQKHQDTPTHPGLIVPYEWYRARETRNCKGSDALSRKALVLWVRDDAFPEHLLKGLQQITEKLAENIDKNDSQESLKFKIVGPQDSSMLRDMLKEAIESPGLSWPNTDRSVQLYSPWVTTMPGLVAYSLRKEFGKDLCSDYERCEGQFTAILQGAGVEFIPTIGSDEELFHILIKELSLRGVNVGRDPIVLIGEWDTAYGRALPVEFRAVACFEAVSNPDIKMPGNEDISKKRQEFCDTLPHAIENQVRNYDQWHELDMKVERFSYLRGLDGMTSGESKESNGQGQSGGKERRKKEENGSQMDIENLERPEGQSQLDYVRRLAFRIKEKAKNVKAIGILGTDVYDESLILQALRQDFPKVIFFATDLDARRLHASEYKWTRNMIIASHFGLQLHEKIQRDVPPFRDSYQTSAFFAVLRALDHIRPSSQDGYKVDLTDEEFSTKIPARLYEVGKNGVIELSRASSKDGRPTIHSQAAKAHPLGCTQRC
ncbi:MAG: hypothetical protein EPO64_00280 [Nitrospirae bacterium]|nr:MAG: hypothetical protein EPO64_00280 [Nitrospirota bacterium]